MIKKLSFLFALLAAGNSLSHEAETAPDTKTKVLDAMMDRGALHECSSSLAWFAWKRMQAESSQDKALIDGLSNNEFKRCSVKYTPTTIYSENSKFAANSRDVMHLHAKTEFIEGDKEKALRGTALANSWDAIATDFTNKAAQAQKTIK